MEKEFCIGFAANFRKVLCFVIYLIQYIPPTFIIKLCIKNNSEEAEESSCFKGLYDYLLTYIVNVCSLVCKIKFNFKLILKK